MYLYVLPKYRIKHISKSYLFLSKTWKYQIKKSNRKLLSLKVIRKNKDFFYSITSKLALLECRFRILYITYKTFIKPYSPNTWRWNFCIFSGIEKKCKICRYAVFFPIIRPCVIYWKEISAYIYRFKYFVFVTAIKKK